MVEQQNNCFSHVSNLVVIAAMDLHLTHHHQNQEIENLNVLYNFAILEILLIVSEFNQTHINRSVCEFYILLTILRKSNKKTNHKKNQENLFQNRDFRKVPDSSSGDVYIDEI